MAVILNPVVNLFILLDSDAVNALASGADVTQVALRCCEQKNITRYFNSSNLTTPYNILNATYSYTTFSYNSSSFFNSTNYVYEKICVKQCDYWCIPMLSKIKNSPFNN